MNDEDLDALAAEYALGTLTAEERDTVEELAEKDPDFADRIDAWERQLGTLEAMVDPIEPPPGIWSRIRERIGEATPDVSMRLPEVAHPDDEGMFATADVVVLARRAQRWRGAAALMGAMAAVLLLAVGIERYRPELVPSQLRPPVQTKVVEKVVEVPQPAQPAQPGSSVPGRFVAVLQRDGGTPAFLLTVDVDKRTFTLRRVTPTPEAGKSYELWLVSNKFPAPRSLGLVGTGEFTERPALASYDADTINSAAYAVSLEPEGGSPTGVPTGPVLFSGKLIEAVPRRP